MNANQETKIHRKDVDKLDAREREQLLKPYLPSNLPQKTTRQKHQPIRMFLKLQLHFVVFTAIHLLFSIYIRLRQAFHIIVDRIFALLYYHHRAPELIRQDIRGLERLPQHLSVILEMKQDERGLVGLEKLLDDVAEISAWCAGAGIPMLSVYERSGERWHAPSWKVSGADVKVGVLKDHIQRTHRVVSSKFYSYFGRHVPTLQIQAPHIPSFLDGDESGRASSSAGKTRYLTQFELNLTPIDFYCRSFINSPAI